MQNKNNNKKIKNFLSLFDKIKNTEFSKNRDINKKNIIEVISYRKKELINIQNSFFKKRLFYNKELNNNNKEIKNINIEEITKNQKNNQINKIKKIKIPKLNLSQNKSSPKTKTEFLTSRNKIDNNFYSNNNENYSSISINLYNTFNKCNNSIAPSKDLSLNNNISTNSKTILKTNNSGDSISNNNYQNIFYKYNKVNTTKFKCYENNALKQFNNLYKTSIDNNLYKNKKTNKNIKLVYKNKFLKIKNFFENSNESNNNIFLYSSRTNLSNGNNYNNNLNNSDNTSFYKEIKSLEYQNDLASFHLKKIIKDWHYVPIISNSFNNDIEDILDKKINYLKDGKYEVKTLIKNDSFKKIFKNYWNYIKESKYTKNKKNNQKKKIEILKEKIRKECVNAEKIKLKIKFKKNENFLKKLNNL